MDLYTTLSQHTPSHFLSYVTAFNTLLLLSCRYRLGKVFTSLRILQEELPATTRSSGSPIPMPYETTIRGMRSIRGTLPKPSSRTSANGGRRKKLCDHCGTPYRPQRKNQKFCDTGCQAKAAYIRKAKERLYAQQEVDAKVLSQLPQSISVRPEHG